MTSFILESTLKTPPLIWVPCPAVMFAAVLDESIEQSSGQTEAATRQVDRAARDLDTLAKHLNQILRTVRRDAPETPPAASTEIERRAS